MARRGTPIARATERGTRPAIASTFAWSLGVGGSLIGLAASSVLALAHFRGIDLPGCGAGSGCASAAASQFGTLPVVGLPTSFLGVAYFAGLFAAWLAGRRGSGAALRWVSRAGVVAAVLLLFAMVNGGWFCAYCVTAHAGAILAWIAAERSGSESKAGRWQPLAFVGAGLTAMVALVVADSGATKAGAKRAENRLAESERRIAEATASQTPVTTAPVPRDQTTVAATPAGRFEGRYRRGSESARVRVVLFTDYQCPDCKRIEGELAAILAHSPDVAASIKLFPLNVDCNPHAPGQMHANACWASRAAEAAGIVGGVDGFWKMHAWLFARGGSFTDAELDVGLAQLGFPREAFLAAMTGPLVNERISADVAEGMRLGIGQTPMIFINGVELKGWNVPNALERGVVAALSATPAANTAAADAPPDGAARFMADWRESAVQTIPDSELAHMTGPVDAPIRVVIFGDYMEPSTLEADGLVRLFTTGERANVRYSFVPFPVDKACNVFSQVTLHPMSCRTSLAAEAAGVLDGPEGFWRMHEWLAANREGMNEASILGAAQHLGLDPAAFTEALSQPFLQGTITRNARLGNRLGLRSIPMIFVNGRQVARWKWENENLLGRILLEAAEHAGHGH